MIQLVANNRIPDRPSNFELARRIVKDILREEPHAFFLWTDGRWVVATVDDIMRRANVRQKSVGKPQFTNKPSWIVK